MSGSILNAYVSPSTQNLLSGGEFGSGARLVLDGIQFREFELPEELAIGGTHAIAIHRAIGGKRVVDAMGPEDTPIGWSGLLFGPLAEQKAQLLDLLRRSGRAVELSWSGFAWTVVVTTFKARLKGNYQVLYEIECTVVEDLVAGSEPEEVAAFEESLGASLAAASAAAQTTAALLQMVVDVQIAVRTAMLGRAVLRGLGQTALATLTVVAVNAAANAAAYALTSDAALGAAGADGFGGVEAGGDPEAMAGAFGNTLSASQDAVASRIVTSELDVSNAMLGGIAP